MSSTSVPTKSSNPRIVTRTFILLLVVQAAAVAVNLYLSSQTSVAGLPLIGVQAVGALLTLLIIVATGYYLNAKLSHSSAAIRQVRSETDQILATVKDGLFLLSPEFQIGNHYSRAMEQLLNQSQLAGKNFLQLLQGVVPENTVNLCEDYLKLLFGNRVNENLVTDLNPLDKVEVFFQDQEGGYQSKFLEFSFKRVMDSGKSDRVEYLLVHAHDVTDRVKLERQLERAQEKSREQLDLLFKVLHVEPQLLARFVGEVNSILGQINDILKERAQTQHDYVAKIGEIESRIATIADNAAKLGLQAFEDKANAFRPMLDEFRNKESLDGKAFLPLAVKLDEFIALLDALRPLVSRIGSLKVAARNAPASAAGGEGRAAHRLSPIEEYAVNLANSEGKRVQLTARGIDAVPAEYQQDIQEILNELIRNSITHGIEMARERLFAGKAEVGQIFVNFLPSDGEGYDLVYRDDGRGLSENDVKRTAIQRGITSEQQLAGWDRKRLLSLIFKPGFTTLKEADGKHFNDKGEGLSRLSARVRQKNGKLWLTSTAGKSCQFRIWLPEISSKLDDEFEIN